MAESVNTVCVKCKLNHQDQSDNILKCHGGCETFIRYVCSAYKPTELRLFEAYNQNIKWFYNMYAKEHEVLNVNDLHSKILDASTQALEAHLFQKEEDGKIGNILFGSRKLLTADKNYTITELELLGIVFAYHPTLSFLFNCKILSGRLIRWVLLLTEYQQQIEYIKGTENVVANFLYRFGHDDQQKGVPITINITRIKIPQLKDDMKDLPQRQREDSWISSLSRPSYIR
ncbi:RNase H-like domain found in reverse transcriptase [Popillia japonica]|uniref:RNase H-like domain found in reverse transcriptase n=1 Tax=Popillia japonica TaxID=7064 RepID=A0AAW1I788_POPJA